MRDLLVHSDPVQCTVTVSVHCNNKDFQDLIFLHRLYLKRASSAKKTCLTNAALLSLEESSVLISNRNRLFDALHPTVGHFQSFTLSSFTFGFMQTLPVSMFFPFLLFNLTVFSYFDKNTLQPGNFHMSQGKASAVQQKGWLCFPQKNMKSHLVNPAAYGGGRKQHFVFAYSQVQICSGGYCNSQKALPTLHSERWPALMLSQCWMLIWVVISCVRRTLLMCEMASGSLADKMSDWIQQCDTIVSHNLRCLVLTCNWN